MVETPRKVWRSWFLMSMKSVGVNVTISPSLAAPEHLMNGEYRKPEKYLLHINIGKLFLPQNLWMRVWRGNLRSWEGDVWHEEHHLLGQQDLSVPEQECCSQRNWHHHVKLLGGLPDDGVLKVTLSQKYFYKTVSENIWRVSCLRQKYSGSENQEFMNLWQYHKLNIFALISRHLAFISFQLFYWF